MKYKMTFTNFEILLKHGDYEKYKFYFKYIDTKYIGKPEEDSKQKITTIKVKISKDLYTQWNLYPGKELEKVLFEFGKRNIIEKIKDKTIQENESINLSIFGQDKTRPYNPDRIEDPDNYSEIIEIPEKSLQENMKLNQLAAGIIDRRDKINAIFHEKYKCKLFIFKSERDSSQLFKEANSEEEFTSRSCSLANLVTNINGNKLKEILVSSSKENKTIDLFEEYLKSLTHNYEDIIKIFRNINKIRQAFPVHRDENSGLIEAYRFFNIKYPIDNYNEAWKKLLNNYSINLEKILNIFKEQEKKYLNDL